MPPWECSLGPNTSTDQTNFTLRCGARSWVTLEHSHSSVGRSPGLVAGRYFIKICCEVSKPDDLSTELSNQSDICQTDYKTLCQKLQILTNISAAEIPIKLQIEITIMTLNLVNLVFCKKFLDRKDEFRILNPFLKAFFNFSEVRYLCCVFMHQWCWAGVRVDWDHVFY